MSTELIEIVESAADLPDKWNVAAGDCLFLRRKSLLVMEKTNYCDQLYHSIGTQGACSIAVTYRHRLNLLTYGKGSISLPVTMIGIPCSRQ